MKEKLLRLAAGKNKEVYLELGGELQKRNIERPNDIKSAEELTSLKSGAKSWNLSLLMKDESYISRTSSKLK